MPTIVFYRGSISEPELAAVNSNPKGVIVYPVKKVTDRAKRYRAQKNVSGPKKCVICDSRRDRVEGV